MQKMAEHLTALEKRHLLRKTTSYMPISPTQVWQKGKEYLMLASNNYLGLTHHPFVIQSAIEAIYQYGTGAGGARLTTGTYPLVEELERELADFKETEAAVVFNAGYMANVGIISSLAKKDDIIYSDELNHASIIDGCRLSKAEVKVYRHADMKHLAVLLRENSCKGQQWIITDGVFSMDGDIAPLEEIVFLAKRYQAMVIVDDAHATGVIGPGGKGTAAYFSLGGQVEVQIGTLSKSLGAEGGFVTGSKVLVEYIKNTARSFIFTTALAPAVVGAGLASLCQLRAQPELVTKLSENASHMRNRLKEAGIQVLEGQTPIIPIVVGDADKALRLKEYCREQGVILSAIRPPTVPAGTSRLRLTVSAAHGKEELDFAAHVIANGFLT